MKVNKKILIFIDWFLPGYKAGGPIRSIANLTAHLSSEFEFYIITRDTDYLETAPYPDIESNQWQEIAKNIHVYYFSKEKLSVKNIKAVIKSIDFDVVYINGIYSFYFSLLPVWLFRKSNKKVIVASRGMLSKHSFSSKSLRKNLFIFLVKIFKFYRDVYFHVTNQNEKSEISQFNFQMKNYIIAPNLAMKISYEIFICKKTAKNLKLVNISRISKEKNTLFAIQILNNKFSGEVELDLYGSIYQEEYWQECLNEINKLPENVKVNYKGAIDNQKIQEIIKDYHFSFLPTLGENFGHSILESLSYSTPVIISDCTPWRDLQKQKAGWDIPLKNKKKFIDTIQYCINMKQEEYDKWAVGAFNKAKYFSENPEIIAQSKKIFL